MRKNKRSLLLHNKQSLRFHLKQSLLLHNKWLLLILGFALLSRTFFLWVPEQEYFDEVYHAFTARIMLHNDPKAWEWWNPHPPGFAYEWTHPPLAKEIMALSMSVFGEKAFAWRLPGALAGTMSVYLVYLIARKLFNEEIGLLASGVFALDGLVLVMSRIGMNDIYFLVFMLASFYLFLQKKILPSAVMLGLAAASKWSVIWFLPLLALAHFSLKRKSIPKEYLWFLVLPPLIYLASYLPLFWTGHSFEIFWQMQKQMWWYHTGLKATHPYTSPWWSWPILLRPIYLYVGSFSQMTAKIYALGNPLVFWSGLLAVIWGFRQAFKKRQQKLALVLFGYLAFFVPWAASPRIMFLYHYLPSIPFLAIATGYALSKYPKLITPFFVFAFLLFIYFFPHWVGMPIPHWLDNSFYWFKSWR
jgi:predicted membrane-bound dolichyl-phosphate-mannose-protein mannosyltransferase